jgi:hypothetical protein
LGDEDPLFADDSGNVMQNPLLSAAEETKDREWRTFQANAGATIKLLKGLTFRNTTGMRYQTRRNDIFYGDQSMPNAQVLMVILLILKIAVSKHLMC